MTHILVVEDEPALRLGLVDQFRHLGYQVSACTNGQDALKRISQTPAPDLLILDLGLPDMDGTRVLEACRREVAHLPIVILSARANEADIVLGFKLGTHDYVTKPFSPRVLAARVESLLARQTADRGLLLKLGEMTIDFDAYAVQHPTKSIKLTTREFDILRFLYDQQGKPVSRHDLLDEVWGMECDAGPRTVDTHIAALRKKIEPQPNAPTFIQSQRGIGYKLVTE